MFVVEVREGKTHHLSHSLETSYAKCGFTCEGAICSMSTDWCDASFCPSTYRLMTLDNDRLEVWQPQTILKCNY